MITKDGKVSCECCETVCLFYPAAGFYEGLYGINDIPDQMAYYVDNSVLFTLDKVNSIDPFDGLLRIYFGEYEGFFYRITNGFEDFAFWRAWLKEGPEEWAPFDGADNLIDLTGFFSAGTGIKSDFWDVLASSYSVTGPVSGSVIRLIDPVTDPCTWISDGITLRYNSNTFKYQVNGNQKIGFQNTPVGSYAGGYTVS